MRERIESKLIEMLALHKDLQYLPTCTNVEPFLQGYFQEEESGFLGNEGTYKINSKGIQVELWSNRKFRFKWSTLAAKLSVYRGLNQVPLF